MDNVIYIGRFYRGPASAWASQVISSNGVGLLFLSDLKVRQDQNAG